MTSVSPTKSESQPKVKWVSLLDAIYPPRNNGCYLYILFVCFFQTSLFYLLANSSYSNSLLQLKKFYIMLYLLKSLCDSPLYRTYTNIVSASQRIQTNILLEIKINQILSLHIIKEGYFSVYRNIYLKYLEPADPEPGQTFQLQ